MPIKRKIRLREVVMKAKPCFGPGQGLNNSGDVHI